MAITFVAEVSSNHHTDLGRCLRFVDLAAEVGCQAVKFQLFKIDQLFAPEVLEGSEAHRRRRAWELPVSFLPAITARCQEKRIGFACTPFYLGAVEELVRFVDFFKVASYELLWDDLLVACARSGKPLVLSAGMATLEEVRHAVDVVRKAGCQAPTVLHCVSAYPAPPAECNLAAIDTLREACRCEVGWSDHSVSPGVIQRAVHRYGASMIEFHLDLDGEGEEFAAGHCWLPDRIAPLIAEVRAGLEADGDGLKRPAPSEERERLWRADPSDGLRPLRSLRRGEG